MAKITKRTAKESDGKANYENYNVLDADGVWTSVNISFNEDREHAEENFDAIIASLETNLNVTVTQDKPSATVANFGKPSSKSAK